MSYINVRWSSGSLEKVGNGYLGHFHTERVGQARVVFFTSLNLVPVALLALKSRSSMWYCYNVT